MMTECHLQQIQSFFFYLHDACWRWVGVLGAEQSVQDTKGR